MITLDVIGTLHALIVTNETGEYVSGGEQLPGFHVNTIPAMDGWEQYRVQPITKQRVFAGLQDETVCYVFPDEATFREVSDNEPA